MPEKHLSSQFDADLNLVSTKLLEMGGLVETQIEHALQALSTLDIRIAEQVREADNLVNSMEVEIDEEIGNIIARRQPAARDLRLLMAASKTVTNLERVGDEARKIAKRAIRIANDGAGWGINIAEIKLAGELATRILRRALDAFARLDTESAAQIVRDDEAIDEQFRAFVRKLASYMMEDPRSISTGLDYLFVAKAIERIGDHATNIAEFTVYVARGTDVRHRSMDEVAQKTTDSNGQGT
jgi:phosphate transport system protein